MNGCYKEISLNSKEEKIQISGELNYSLYLVVASHNDGGPLFAGLISGSDSISGIHFLQIINKNNYINVNDGAKETPLLFKSNNFNTIHFCFIPLDINPNKKLNIKKI